MSQDQISSIRELQKKVIENYSKLLGSQVSQETPNPISIFAESNWENIFSSSLNLLNYYANVNSNLISLIQFENYTNQLKQLISLSQLNGLNGLEKPNLGVSPVQQSANPPSSTLFNSVLNLNAPQIDLFGLGNNFSYFSSMQNNPLKTLSTPNNSNNLQKSNCEQGDETAKAEDPQESRKPVKIFAISRQNRRDYKGEDQNSQNKDINLSKKPQFRTIRVLDLLEVKGEDLPDFRSVKNNKFVYMHSEKAIEKNKRFNNKLRVNLKDGKIVQNNKKKFHKSKRINPNKASRGSKFRGVSKNGNQWQVLIMVKQKKRYVGSYHNEEEAARYYDKAAIQFHGARTKTNFFYTEEDIDKIRAEPLLLNINEENEDKN